MNKPWTLLILLLLIANIPAAYADDSNATYVEVEPEVDISIPYKERRSRHGFLFSFGAQKYYPNDYQSMQDGKFIEEFIGTTSTDLMNLELGYKYNFGLGSFAIAIGFAKGEFSSKFENLARKIGITKIEGMGYFFADNFFSEPWVVPYIGVGVNRFSVTESLENSEDVSRTVSLTNAIRAGLQFQLNSIDRSGSEDAYRELGMENTFLDVYMTRNTPSTNVAQDSEEIASGDPDTSNKFELGLGLRIEF